MFVGGAFSLDTSIKMIPFIQDKSSVKYPK